MLRRSKMYFWQIGLVRDPSIDVPDTAIIIQVRIAFLQKLAFISEDVHNWLTIRTQDTQGSHHVVKANISLTRGKKKKKKKKINYMWSVFATFCLSQNLTFIESFGLILTCSICRQIPKPGTLLNIKVGHMTRWMNRPFMLAAILRCNPGGDIWLSALI